MSSDLPMPQQLFRAIDVYLRHAYDEDPPRSVQLQLEALHQAQDPYAARPFARTGDEQRPKLALRLGNRFYPHMKLVLEPAPAGLFYLFRADTHDRHIMPRQDHPEHDAFIEMRERNSKIAETIESAWAEAGIPTFKTFLSDDLERRRNSIQESIQ